MAKAKKKQAKRVNVDDYRHDDASRANNPPVGLAHYDTEAPPVRQFEYDPHLDPTLTWAGKAEHTSFEVEAPSIHVHERISAEAIVTSAQRRSDADRSQMALFADERLDRTKAIEFYEHELDWENRMILGDSLVVMTSLLERERLGGQVQCIYIDPPYGVNFNSNFQARVSDRTPKETNDDTLTREPEQIQAYRDTWELGIHSYLTYLRDRLLVSSELLRETGSIFVQIGSENTHRVRVLMDEVFGPENHIATITVQKTSSSTAALLDVVTDDLIWYAKDKAQVKYNQLYRRRDERTADPQLRAYSRVELPTGERRKMSTQEKKDPSLLPKGARRYRLSDVTSQGSYESMIEEFEFEGRIYKPGANTWKTTHAGLQRLADLRRLEVAGETLSYVRFADDGLGAEISNVWTDTVRAGFAEKKRYVVETTPKIVGRALMMATDPGDLVIDPTCGSGTTALVCEQFGRRWITADTSRVALALARERILTAKFPYYKLVSESRGVDGGLVYNAKKRITLGSLAKDEPPEEVAYVDDPIVEKDRVRVSGPFSVEALSRYALNPADTDLPPADTATDRAAAADHVTQLLDALLSQGIPRPDGKPLKIERIEQLASAGAIQAEGVYMSAEGEERRFAVSLGPRFGTITPTQVDEALADAYGYHLVVFAGFAAHAETQALLEGGRRGRYEVALLLANPDLLLGSLLKNTTASQTFRLYASPDVQLDHAAGGYMVTVNGVDAFDASTGEVKSSSQANVRAWFLDTDYDGMVFRIDQAFFPHTASWDSLAKALKGTIDEGALDDMSGFASIPFEPGEQKRCAVRVMTDDGNASEVILSLEVDS